MFNTNNCHFGETSLKLDETFQVVVREAELANRACLPCKTRVLYITMINNSLTNNESYLYYSPHTHKTSKISLEMMRCNNVLSSRGALATNQQCNIPISTSRRQAKRLC